MNKLIKLWHGIYKNDNRTFLQRLGFAALVDFVFAFSVFLFIPYEMYLGNTKEFNFMLSEFMAPLIVAAIIFVVTLAVHMLLKGKLFNVYSSLVFGATVASYIQSMFLNGMMKSLNGTQDTVSATTQTVNFIIWIIILIIPAIISFIKVNFWSLVCRIGSLIIVGSQIVAIFSLLLTAPMPSIETRLSTKGLYDVSKKNNVIVLVLDMFDQTYVDKMLDKYPEALDGMNGFTYYPDATGKYTFTHIAVPYLLTGVDIPEYNPTAEQFVEQTDNSKFFDFVTENAGSTDIYTHDWCIRSNEARSKISNCVKLGYNVSQKTLGKASVKSSLYRVLPFALKQRFIYDSTNFNNAVEFLGNDNITGYVNDLHSNEAQMMEHITKNGLNVNEDYGDSCFKFIHIKATHEYWQLTADVKYDGNNTSMEETAAGTMKLVTEYCEQLDKKGLFDDATIIITADHGFAWVWDVATGLPRVVNPIFMYKPAGATREEPMKTDMTPVSQDDIFATVVKALGGDGSEFGKTIEEASKDTARKRYFYGAFQDPEVTDKESCIHVEYEINGDARNKENWKETGNRVYPNHNPRHKDAQK